jgi:hypothetical protein
LHGSWAKYNIHAGICSCKHLIDKGSHPLWLQHFAEGCESNDVNKHDAAVTCLGIPLPSPELCQHRLWDDGMQQRAVLLPAHGGKRGLEIIMGS